MSLNLGKGILIELLDTDLGKLLIKLWGGLELNKLHVLLIIIVISQDGVGLSAHRSNDDSRVESEAHFSNSDLRSFL